MTRFHKAKTASALKWASSNLVENPKKYPFWQMGSSHIAENPRCYGSNGTSVCSFSRAARSEARAAFFEYLYCTRALQFRDAENMSKNSPYFFEKLLEKVEDDSDVGTSISRFLRYHPINEFEPFFESLGLKPCEFGPLLPQDRLFLSDDSLLLENYQVLCNYGIERNKIGKIYKEAIQVFRYQPGVLPSKLEAYEELGLGQSFMKKVIVCSPKILIGDVDRDFVEVLQTLKDLGFEYGWIEEHLLEQNSYNWSIILQVLSLFSKVGCGRGKLYGLISNQPGLIFEDSGYKTLSFVGFLVKYGSTVDQLRSIFQEFPQIQVGQFVLNLKRCVLFLNEIDMEANEIGKIVCSHFLMLGTSMLMRTNSLHTYLNVGKKRLRKYIQENPQELSKWVMGAKLVPFPEPEDGGKRQSKMLKTKFLLDLGYGEDPEKMKKASKVFRGRGAELQERYDCLVNAGLDKKDVTEMVRVSPQILNQSKEVLQRKIDFLVNELGYAVTTLASFPSYLSYTSQRVKLRLSMYDWLKDEGKAEPSKALSTIVACSNKDFMKQYVNSHPRGPQVWQDLKEQICSEN
ncbi:hypothetical protein SLA2020_236950 [Shorea laevis]